MRGPEISNASYYWNPETRRPEAADPDNFQGDRALLFETRQEVWELAAGRAAERRRGWASTTTRS
jgi:hypothetical protein